MTLESQEVREYPSTLSLLIILLSIFSNEKEFLEIYEVREILLEEEIILLYNCIRKKLFLLPHKFIISYLWSYHTRRF